MIDPTVPDHALALLVGVVLPLLAVLRGQRQLEGIEWDTPTKIGMYWGNSLSLWLMAAAVGGVTWHAGRTGAALGLAPPGTDGLGWGVGVAAALLLAYGLDVGRQLAPGRIEATRRRWRRDTPFMPGTGRELAHYGVLALSAGVCEEIVFRGYLVPYLGAFTGTSTAGLALAVTVPALVFGFAHRYQGPAAMAKVFVGALGFGALLLLTASLWIPIALHVAIDLAGGLLAPRLLGEGAAGADPGSTGPGPSA